MPSRKMALLPHIGHGSCEFPVLLKLKFYKLTLKLQYLALKAGVEADTEL